MAYNKNDPKTIQTMFNSIAERYDLTNSVLSMQMHKRWNHTLVSSLMDSSSHTVVDLCCGTGDIAFDYLKTTTSPCEIYLVDFCSNMLACAKEKSHKLLFPPAHQLQFLEADVQVLPFENELADRATMAYGIRNVKNPEKAIQEVHRILKPGGRFGILELTRPTNRFLRLGHQLYLQVVLPLLGKFLTNNKEAYSYLQGSIDSFIAPADLEQLFIKNGFIHTRRISLSGGIATIIIGEKSN